MRGIANRMRARMEQRIPPPVRARMDQRAAARRGPTDAAAKTVWVENPTTKSESLMLAPVLAATTTVDALTFAIAGAVVLTGAVGVVVARNPVHSALMLVMTLFGVAVLFVEQQANFLAAVQVIVYAGAIVVLFLFVIMFLGVDREESLDKEPLRAQRPLAVGLIVLGLAGLLLMGFGAHWSVGAKSVAGPIPGPARRRRGRPGQVGVHDVPVRLRDHLGPARDRRRGCGGAGPATRGRARWPGPTR